MTGRASDPLRLALIGAGRIGSAYAAAAAGLREVRLVAVADVDPRRAAAVADICGAEPRSDWRDALGSGAEAVLICTPPCWHAEQAMAAAERGLHVLCEKPLALNVREAMEMIDTARRRGVLLTMASKFRYVDDIPKARALIDSGEIGDVVLLENSFTSRLDLTGRWNADPAISGGGVLIDNGTHSVDIVRCLLGPIEAVRAVVISLTAPGGVEDTVHMFARCAAGPMASVHLSWRFDRRSRSYLDIYGSAGVVRVGWRGSWYRRDRDEKWIRFGRGYDKIRALRKQLAGFARAVRGREPLAVSDQDALASVEVIAAAYRAVRSGGWEAVGSQGATVSAAPSPESGR
ncbi:MAG: gfo/Idh/MocA family oxidoreductase [Acidobacteria bacterium]|nr:MAG: gfo/Idh/MocA family oxidoreductase [Acidobacteriota bacterium]